MSLLSQLKNKKLNPTTTTVRSDNLKPTLCENSEDYYRLMNETQFEKYYEVIRPYTFHSTMFPLSVEAALAIMDGYKTLSRNEEFNWKNNENLVKLAEDIDKAKAKHIRTNDIFVRLSSRSPKDAAIGARGLKIYQASKEKVKAINKEMNDTLSTEDNVKLHALYITGTEALRIQNGAQAIELFINSNRIQEDLDHYVKMPGEFNVVVREFANFEVLVQTLLQHLL